MAYDYNKLYGETRDALGDPNPALVAFFQQFDGQNLRVLDVGCGQGRDAVFIARLGHNVVGVDISENGVRDLNERALREKLLIEGAVADITTYTPAGLFDLILIDRTLHMLELPTRLMVLNRLVDHVAENGWLLILDEASSIGEFETTVAAHATNWKTEFPHRGFLFLRRL